MNTEGIKPPSQSSRMMRKQTPNQIIWADRLKIGRKLFPQEKDLNKLLVKVEHEFHLEPLEIKKARIENKGPSFTAPCTIKGCNGRMWPFPPPLDEAKKGIMILFICKKCEHQLLSGVHPKIWMEKEKTLSPKEAEVMTKPIPNFMKRTQTFLSAKFVGPRVTEDVFQLRMAGCGVNQPKAKQCPKVRLKGAQMWCGACGCGFRKDAELRTKLRMSRVECPLIPPMWKAIDEEKEKHLLQK